MITFSQALRLLKPCHLYGVYLKNKYGHWDWHSMKEITDKYDLTTIYVTHIETYFSLSDGDFNGFKFHTKHPEAF